MEKVLIVGHISHEPEKLAAIQTLAKEKNAELVVVEKGEMEEILVISSPKQEPIILPFTKPKELSHCYVYDDVRKSSSQPWSKEYKYKNKRR